MSKAGAAYAKHANEAAKQNGGKRDDVASHDKNDSPENKRALKTLQKEAAEQGSFLASGGKGGLPSQEVLGIFRRAKYRCEHCGELGSKANGGLSVHHKGGVPANKKLSAMGHKNTPKNFEAICVKEHDLLHQEARKRGVDSSQVLPAGDKGTDRDHGDKPLATPGAGAK